MHSVEFRPELVELPVDARQSEPWLLVRVTLFVDGEPLEKPGTQLCFDAATCLALGSTPYREFYPFTCSCGIPGCAGYFTATKQEVDEFEVRWRLPADPFAELLHPKYAVEDGGAVVRFDRVKYESALTALLEQLEAMERQHGKPANIWMGQPDDDARPLREQIAEHRDGLLEWEASCVFRDDVIPDLIGQELVITTAAGVVYTIPLENLAFTLADVALGLGFFDSTDRATCDERRELVARDIAPKFRQGVAHIVAAARVLSWSLMCWVMFTDSDEQHQAAPDGDDRWPEVSFELRVIAD